MKSKFTSYILAWGFQFCRWFWFMAFNVTFNNISVISWRQFYWWRKSEYPEKNHRPVASHCQTLSHNIVMSTPRHEWGSNSQL